MSLWFNNLLIMWYFIGYNARPQRGLPFPHLSDFQLSDIGKPVHIFEGIDYDELPQNFRDEYSDCYTDQIKCLRLRTHLTPVCGYYLYYRTFMMFLSICELHLQNCLMMVNMKKFSKYGRNANESQIFFIGEGYKCEHYVRSGGKKGVKTTILNTTIA